MNLLKGSALLKITALTVAVLTYFYIHNEIYNTEKNNPVDDSYKLIKLTAKSLPVKVRLETTPPEGYRILEDRVSSTPAMVTVIAPEALLENTWDAQTSIVDVGENTKTVTRRVPLENVAGVHLVGEPYLVEVTVPIEKIPVPVLGAENAAPEKNTAPNAA
jgi:hypothetical protein